MQKPRPKEAIAPRQQQSVRGKSGSHEGASAPFVAPGGEKAAANPPKPAEAPETAAKRLGTEPAVIMFGYNEHRIPQAAWFPEAEADLERV